MLRVLRTVTTAASLPFGKISKRLTGQSSKSAARHVIRGHQSLLLAAANAHGELLTLHTRDGMHARDRSDGDALLITQSLLAEMLGVHRPSITIRSGLIDPGQRQVTILDRRGLTEASCECYQRSGRVSPSQDIRVNDSRCPTVQ
jgi:hypothetical protein